MEVSFDPQNLKVEWELTHQSLNNFQMLRKRKQKGETITEKDMQIKSFVIKNESKNSIQVQSILFIRKKKFSLSFLKVFNKKSRKPDIFCNCG